MNSLAQVSSLEIENRTIAELGTSPVHRYEPSWQAVAKKEEDAKAAAAAAAASANAAVAAGTAIVGTATAGTATTATATRAAATATATAPAASGFGSKAALGSGSGRGSGSVGSSGGDGDGGEEGLAEGGATVTAAEREAKEAAAAKAPQISRKRRKVDRDIKNKAEERAIKEWVGQLPGAGLDAYDPLRGDFTHEHDNSSEMVRRGCGWLALLAC